MKACIAYLTFLTSMLMVLPASGQVLTAEEAVRIALEQNYGIRLARLDAESAAVLNSPGQAGMLPVVEGIASYSIDNSGTVQTFFSGEVREVDDADARVLDAGVLFNWTVFDGLTMFATKDRLETLELIGQTQLQQQVEATLYDVLSNYYRLVQLRRAIAVEREGLRISRERLTIAEAGQRIGTASGLVVVQAQLDLATDSSSVLDLQLNESLTLARLNALLSRDPATAVEVLGDVPDTETLDLAQLQEAARQANSTLQEARQYQIAADLNVKELRGALLPQLDVFANYGYTRSESAVGFLQSNQSLGPAYGAQLSIPLFNGSRNNQAVQVAKLRREQASLSTQQTQLDLEEQVLNAWATYTTGRQRVALEQVNVDGARTQAGVALESYRLGAITAVELRDVQLGLIAASERLILARYEALMAQLQLKWLAGQLG
jgi:outer membrane protein TolC